MPTQAWNVEYTDTFGGEANYCWVKRAQVHVPELTHYGYTGSTDGSYAKANRAQVREIMRKAKAAVGNMNLDIDKDCPVCIRWQTVEEKTS